MVCSGRPGNLAACPTGGPVVLGWTPKSGGIVREAQAVDGGVTLSSIENGFDNPNFFFLELNFEGGLMI